MFWVVAIVGVAIWGFFRWFEQTNLYFPDRTMSILPATYGLPYEKLTLETTDKVHLRAWFIPASQKPAAYTLLLCHGNAGNISHRVEKAQRLHRLGVNVLLFDYRGYGESEGWPSEQGVYRDAEAAYTYLVKDRAIDPRHIIFYGESLGCAVAVEMAKRHPAAGLILESAFTSVVAMTNRIFPWLPARWIIHDRYDNLRKIPAITTPLLMLHSPTDEIVPFAMGQQLFAAANAPKQFVELSGGHNDGYEISGTVYTEAIQKWLKGLAR